MSPSSHVQLISPRSLNFVCMHRAACYHSGGGRRSRSRSPRRDFGGGGYGGGGKEKGEAARWNPRGFGFIKVRVLHVCNVVTCCSTRGQPGAQMQ